MKTKQIHILNGDSTLHKFRESKIEGEVMVWRETLSLGPLFYQIDSEVFWEMRSQFIEKAYHDRLSSYRKKVLNEFKKLRKFQGNEITLWFEYDFYCQINMIALLSYLLRNKKGTTISLVCVGDMKGFEERLGLGEIPTSLYNQLFLERKKLSTNDLIQADKAWMIYCSKDWEKLKDVNYNGFDYLYEALNLGKYVHQQKNSLSSFELDILNIIRENKFSHHKLIGYLLRNKKELGFGDLQHEYMIKNLNFFIKEDNGILSLNGQGKAALEMH